MQATCSTRLLEEGAKVTDVSQFSFHRYKDATEMTIPLAFLKAQRDTDLDEEPVFVEVSSVTDTKVISPSGFNVSLNGPMVKPDRTLRYLGGQFVGKTEYAKIKLNPGEMRVTSSQPDPFEPSWWASLAGQGRLVISGEVEADSLSGRAFQTIDLVGDWVGGALLGAGLALVGQFLFATWLRRRALSVPATTSIRDPAPQSADASSTTKPNSGVAKAITLVGDRKIERSSERALTVKPSRKRHARSRVRRRKGNS